MVFHGQGQRALPSGQDLLERIGCRVCCVPRRQVLRLQPLEARTVVLLLLGTSLSRYRGQERGPIVSAILQLLSMGLLNRRTAYLLLFLQRMLMMLVAIGIAEVLDGQ